MTGPTNAVHLPACRRVADLLRVPFAKAFTTDLKRVAVQYPGKGGTHDLTSFRSIPDLADRVMKLLPAPTDDSTVAIFGLAWRPVAFGWPAGTRRRRKPHLGVVRVASPSAGRRWGGYIPGERPWLDWLRWATMTA